MWMKPPATWKTLRPNSQAISKTANKIVKILINPPCDFTSTTYKNPTGLNLECLINRAHDVRLKIAAVANGCELRDN